MNILLVVKSYCFSAFSSRIIAGQSESNPKFYSVNINQYINEIRVLIEIDFQNSYI